MSSLHKFLVERKAQVYLEPREFLKAVVEYFEWIEEHPLLEDKVFMHQGEIIRTNSAKARPFTKQGLATYLGIPVSRLDTYKKREGWEDVVEMIDQVIYDQKFSNAAAGLMNASIISRDLGLAEKSEITGGGGQPLQLMIEPIRAGTFLQEDET